jgi:hypothetical protein
MLTVDEALVSDESDAHHKKPNPIRTALVNISASN